MNTSHAIRFRCYKDVSFYILNTPSKINFILVALIALLLTIPAVIMNAGYLYTTYRYPRFRKTVSNVLMINLAALNLIIATVNIPLHGIQMLLYSSGESSCMLTMFNDFASFAIFTPVFVTLLFITLDTYCGVMLPFFYQSHVTPVKTMVAKWMVSSTLIILTVLAQLLSIWSYYTVIYFVVLILVIVFFMIAYGHIYKHVTQMHRRVSCVSNVSTSSQGGTEKTIKTSVVIIIVFVASFLPSGIYLLFGAGDRDSEAVRTFLFPWLQTLRLSSALVNVFVYYWRIAGIKKATMNLLPDFCKPAVDYKAKKESYLRKVSMVQQSSTNMLNRFSNSYDLTCNVTEKDPNFKEQQPSNGSQGDHLKTTNLYINGPTHHSCTKKLNIFNQHGLQVKTNKKKVSIIEPSEDVK